MRRLFRAFLVVGVMVLGCTDPVAPPTEGGIGLVIRVAEDEASVAALAAVDQALARIVGPAGENSQEVTRNLTIGGTDTLTGFDEGTYDIGLEGYDAGALTMYGERSGIRVTPGGNTQANVTVASFLPPATPFGQPSTTLFRFTVQFGAVAGATSYQVQVAQDAGFTVGVQTLDTPNTSMEVGVADVGTYFYRARALTQFGQTGDWGPAESVDVISDGVDTDQTLGAVVPGTPLQLGSLNIFPATDIDVFTVDACEEDVLVVTMNARSLTPSSDLDAELEVFDPTGNLVASNSGADAMVQQQLPRHGTYRIEAGALNDNSVGHYELIVELQAGGQRNGNVCAGGGTSLAFTDQPQPVLQGDPMPAVRVSAVDDNANVVTDETGTVTIALIGGGGATLNGTLSRPLVDGVATFGDLSIDIGGQDYRLVATAPDLPSATSVFFDIDDGVTLTKLGFSVEPSDITAGGVIAPAVVVQGQTAVGDLVPTFVGDVTVQVTGGSPAITGTLTVTAVNGEATFSDLSMTTAGTFTLDASTTVGIDVGTSAAFSVAAEAAAMVTANRGHNQVAPSNTLLPDQLVAGVVDQFGNSIEGVTVTWTVTGGGGTLAQAMSTTDVNGEATNDWTLGATIGAQTVEAAVSGLTPAVFDATAANSVQWTNAAGGDWNDGANWSGGVVPGASDVAIIDLDGTFEVTLTSDIDVAAIEVGGPTGGQSLTINPNDVADGLVITTDELRIGPNGSVAMVRTDISGDVDVEGRLVIEGGVAATRTAAFVEVQATGQLLLGGASTADVGFLRTAGRVTIQSNTASEEPTINSSVGLIVQTGGILETTGPGNALIQADVIVRNGATIQTNNDGTLTINAATVRNNDGGVIDLVSGDLVVDVSDFYENSGTITTGADRFVGVVGNSFTSHASASYTLGSGTIVDIGTTNAQFDASLTIPDGVDFSFDGSSNGSQTASVTGTVVVAGPSAYLDLLTTALVATSLTNNGNVSLDDATLNADLINREYVYASGSGSAITGNITNQVDATLEVSGNTTLSSTFAFDNAGEIALSGGSGENPTLTVLTGSPVDDPQPGLPCCLRNLSTGVINQVGDATGIIDLLPGGVSLQNEGLIYSDGVGGITINSDAPFNTGTIDVNLGTVELGGTRLFANGGTIIAEGTFVRSGDAIDNNSGAVIQGGGTFQTVGVTFRNFGTIAPGSSPGRLFIDGDVFLEADGTLVIEIDGLDVVTEYDQLQVGGTATLGGTLDIQLGAFTPTAGDVFDVVDFSVVSGDFTQVLNATIDPSNDFLPSIGNTYRLTVGAPVGGPTPTDMLFASERDGNVVCGPSGTRMCPDVFFRSADGQVTTNLTNSPNTFDDAPMWSPDGGQVAFESDRDGDFDIWVMNPDGSNLVNLTPSATGADFYPSYSPDGTRIAFASDRDFGVLDVWVMNTDGSDPVNLTQNSGAVDGEPTWSPLGDQIAFLSLRDGNQEIYVMNADGSNQVNITNDPGEDRFPSWSPVDSRIAFTSDRFVDLDLFTVNSDGSGLLQLTTDVADDFHTGWAPDGGSIFFSSARAGSFTQLFEMTDTGGSQQQLFVSPGNDFQPHLQRVAPAPITIAAARGITQADLPIAVEGVVTWQPTFDNRVVFIQDETAGIALFSANSLFGPLSEGDSIRVVGGANVFRGETQLSPIVKVTALGAVAVRVPRIVTAAEINAGMFQGELIRITATVDSVVLPGALDNHNVYLTDANGDVFRVWVDLNTGIASTDWTVGSVVTVTGPASTDDTQAPAPAHRLEIRGPADMVAATLSVDAGDGQTAEVAQTVAVPPSVSLVDTGGLPVPGVTVDFTVTGGAGSVMPSSVVTDVNGLAAVTSWTMGTVAGADNNTLDASINGGAGGTVTFTASATPAATATVSMPNRPMQVGQLELLAPTVEDMYGNAISGAPTTFGSLNTNTLTIDAGGLASALVDGQVTVSATVDGITGYGVVTVTDNSSTPITGWTSQFVGSGTTFTDLWGAADDDVWAAADGFMFHWNGASWVSEGIVGVPTDSSISPTAMWGFNGSDIWLTGILRESAFAHYDGVNWTLIQRVGTDTTEINGIWGSAPNDIWAVGEDGTGGLDFGVIYHYDGVSWTEWPSVPSVGPLQGVWGDAPDNVWAVGSDGAVLRFDGTDWNNESQAGFETFQMKGVRGFGTANDIVAWGFDTNPALQQQPIMDIAEDCFGGPCSYIFTRHTTPTDVIDIDAVWGSNACPDIYAVSPFALVAMEFRGMVLDGCAFGGPWAQEADMWTLFTVSDVRAVWGTGSGDVWVAGDGLMRGSR